MIEKGVKDILQYSRQQNPPPFLVDVATCGAVKESINIRIRFDQGCQWYYSLSPSYASYRSKTEGSSF